MPALADTVRIGASGSTLYRAYVVNAFIRKTPIVRIVGLSRVTITATQISAQGATLGTITPMTAQGNDQNGAQGRYQAWPVMTMAAFDTPQSFTIHPMARLLYLLINDPEGDGSGQYYINIHAAGV